MENEPEEISPTTTPEGVSLMTWELIVMAGPER